MEEEIDYIRQLGELGVTSGRSHQSPQTQFVHYCHYARDEEQNHTIPLLENLLFISALLRTRTAQNVQEAKALLSRLLYFQNRSHDETHGNFPAYIHEYPHSKDHYSGCHLLPVFYWILHEFQKILGKELKGRVDSAVKDLLTYAKGHMDAAPFALQMKIAASLTAFGKLYNESDWSSEGQATLDRNLQESLKPNFGTWFSPINIAETLIALQMVYPKISESPWKHFWKYISQTWFYPARTYIGPSLKQLHWKREPQPTLYDLFLGDFTSGYPYHSFIDHPFQLQGILVQPIDDSLEPIETPMNLEGEVAGNRWMVFQEKEYAYSALEMRYPTPSQLRKGYHPFRMVWGDRNIIHSFVCQGGYPSSVTFEKKEDGCDLLFYLDEEPPKTMRGDTYEITFFCDKHDDLGIFVEGKKATTFNLGQEILLTSPERKVRLQFTLEDGDGRFFGHLQPGNRPSQVDSKGKNRFTAYDMQIALRTIKRRSACTIRASVRFV